MRRGTVLIAAIAAAIACVPAAASSQLCVGKQPGCFATIAEALDAAQDGDTIAIGPGTFAGGIAITKSVNLVGVKTNRAAIGARIKVTVENSGAGTRSIYRTVNSGGSLGGLSFGHALLEFIDPAGGIDELLLTRVEGMAHVANTDNNHGLGGARLDHVAARATNL